MMINTNYKYYLKEFERFIEVKNYRNKEYLAHAKELINWVQSKGIDQIEGVGQKEIFEYYERLRFRPKYRGNGILSDSSVHKHLNGIKKFFEFLIDERYIDAAPHILRHKISERKETITLTKAEIKLLYGTCQTPTERALLSLAYGCGLRRSELRDLLDSDIDLHKKVVVVRSGKNSKRREVPIHDTVLKDLKAYKEYRKELMDLNNPVRSFFIGNHRRGVNGDTLYKWLKKILKRSGIKKQVTLHGLRHSLAEHLREDEAPMEFIQAILGHSMSDTTQIYATKKRMHLSKNLKILKIR